MKQYGDFIDLDVWKLGHSIRKEIYILTKRLPSDERYNLISQSRRSATSICANLAEGHGRFHYQENIQYCRQARGSIEETRDHCIGIGALYTHLQEECTSIIKKCLLVKKKVNGYIAYLKKKKAE